MSVVFTMPSFKLSLNELQKFVQMTVEGLGQPVNEDDRAVLVAVMTHLLAIRDRQTATDKMFDPLRDTITLLEQYDVTVPDQVYSQLEVRETEHFHVLHLLIHTTIIIKCFSTLKKSKMIIYLGAS